MSEYKKRIRQFLAKHNTVTIATVHGHDPWAGAVFYVSDDGLNLYFKTDPLTWRGQDLAISQHVAATIQDDGQAWTEITGMQIAGDCELVEAKDEERVHALYVERFAFLKEVNANAVDASMRVLAERLEKTPYYCLRPTWMRLIDNTLGFGHKVEITLDQD